MNKIDLTILEKDEIFGTTALEIFKKRGTKAAISDYAICSGGYVSNNDYTGNIQKLENRTGWYWNKTDDEDDDARIVYLDGTDSRNDVSKRSGGVRVTLPFSSISNICSKKVVAKDGILEVEYGEYPQKAVSKILQNKLEKLYQSRSLRKTGKKYTRDKIAYNQYDQNDQKFQEELQGEYEYRGKKYIRVRVKRVNFYHKEFTLSNGKKYKDGDYVWIEVEPIKWLVDEKKNIAVTEKLLFAGVQFKHTRDYKGGKDFKNTDLKWFLDTHFSKEIIPSSIKLSQTYQKTGSTNFNIPNYKLQPERRNPIITESNLIKQPGINITIKLPSNLKVNCIQTETSDDETIELMVQSSNNPQKQKVYTLDSEFLKQKLVFQSNKKH